MRVGLKGCVTRLAQVSESHVLVTGGPHVNVMNLNIVTYGIRESHGHTPHAGHGYVHTEHAKPKEVSLSLPRTKLSIN